MTLKQTILNYASMNPGFQTHNIFNDLKKKVSDKEYGKILSVLNDLSSGPEANIRKIKVKSNGPSKFYHKFYLAGSEPNNAEHDPEEFSCFKLLKEYGIGLSESEKQKARRAAGQPHQALDPEIAGSNPAVPTPITIEKKATTLEAWSRW